MKEVVQKYVDEMLKVSTVSESAKGKVEYVLGIYNNRVPINGLYLKAEKGSPLERVERKAKLKFQLECDPENYAQEARVIFFQQLEKYLNKYGVPENEIEENKMFGYIHNACVNRLTNIAREAKSNRAVYDKETNEYNVINLLSINSEDEGEEGEEIISKAEVEIAKVMEEVSRESFSEFKRWFDENKTKFLTKKQISYLENNDIISDSNVARMNKKISERTLKNYTEDRLLKQRIEKVSSKKEVLEYLLQDLKDRQLMYRLVNTIKKENWLIEPLYELSLSTCGMITKACKTKEYECKKECVNEIRKELYRLYSYFSRVLEELEKNL